MFGWIEKVMPQPPETPKKPCPGEQDSAQPIHKSEEKETCLEKEAINPQGVLKAQEIEEQSEKGATGVLSWLTQGLGKVVPQPIDSLTLSHTNKESTPPTVAQEPPQVFDIVEKEADERPREQIESAPVGVLSWLSHGLEKVVPQPSWTQKSGTSGGQKTEENLVAPPEEQITVIEDTKVTTVSPVPESQPTIIEVQPEPKMAVTDKGTGAGVLDWLKQGLGKVVPQPEHPVVPPAKPEEVKTKQELQPAPSILKESKGSMETGVIGWITYGLEKVIPQPAIISKQEPKTITFCPVEEKGSGV